MTSTLPTNEKSALETKKPAQLPVEAESDESEDEEPVNAVGLASIKAGMLEECKLVSTTITLRDPLRRRHHEVQRRQNHLILETFPLLDKLE